MATENYWTNFCDDIRKKIADVSDDFKDDDIKFEEKAFNIELKHKSDEESINSMKTYFVGLTADGNPNKAELTQKVDEMIDSIQERDNKISQLKEDIRKTKEHLEPWYKKTKKHYENLFDKLTSFTNDKMGILSLFSDIVQAAIDRDGFYVEKTKEKVKNIISNKNTMYKRGVAMYVILFVVALLFMTGMFIMVGIEDGFCGIKAYGIGKYIVMVFMLALFVGLIFIIIRIKSLSQNKCGELKKLESFLNKLEINKMSRFEIEKELNHVLEEQI